MQDTLKAVTKEARAEWKAVGEGELVKDFVRRLLERNVAKRLTAKEALRHPFLVCTKAGEAQRSGCEDESMHRFISDVTGDELDGLLVNIY